MRLLALDDTALRKHPLPPVINGGKETKGRILVVAGSREVPGAALLCATGAMRAGAGTLRMAVPQSSATGIGLAMPEAMVLALPENSDGTLGSHSIELLEEQARQVDSVVAGPGMARGRASAQIVSALVATAASIALDAALLHALRPQHRSRTSPPLLLPHSRELASLLDCDEDEIGRDPAGCGLHAAELYQSIVLVKGADSHIVTPGGDAWHYKGATPGLGVSGSGDVLAGIVGGLLARGTPPLNALLWAVWLHGKAGAVLTKRVGRVGFLARQIADEIPSLLPG